MGKSSRLKRKLKEELNKLQSMNELQSIKTVKSVGRTITTSDNLGNSISTTVSGMAFFPMKPQVAIAQEKENTMHIHTSDPNYAQRKHLIDRAFEAREEHLEKLNQHYHIHDTDTSEWSCEDFIKAIKSDMFVYRDEKKAKQKGSYISWNIAADIKFRDPSKPADHDGYKTASVKMVEAFESTVDSIVVEEPVKARKEVDKFRETTFH